MRANPLFSASFWTNAAIFFVEHTIHKDAVKKHTFGSVGETAGTEIGDKRHSEGGAMVKTTGCYVEFYIKNNSTNSMKSALHRVCTLLLYTFCHVGWTKS
jgi:hypothetical protein